MKILIKYGKHSHCEIPWYKFYKIPKLIIYIAGNAGTKKEIRGRIIKNVRLGIKI